MCRFCLPARLVGQMQKRSLYVDNSFFPSVFDAATEFDFSFSTFLKEINRHSSSFFYAHHLIELSEWRASATPDLSETKEN